MALPNAVVFTTIAVLSVYSVTANSPIASPTTAPVAAPKSAPPPPEAMTPPAPPPEKTSSTTPPSEEPSPPSMISATPGDAPGPSANGGEGLKKRKVGISGALVSGLLGVVLVM